MEFYREYLLKLKVVYSETSLLAHELIEYIEGRTEFNER